MKNIDLAITGIGYLSSAGIGEEGFYNQINNQLKSEKLLDFDPQLYLGKKGNRYLNNATKLYCNLTYQCLNQNNLQEYVLENPEKVGLYDGSELSNLYDGFLFDLIAKVDGPDLASPMSAPNTIANASSSQMAIRSKIVGPNFTVSGGACGSIQALDIASIHLRNNQTEKAIIGSTEVITKYQTFVRKGEHRNSSIENSNDQGVAFSIEKNSDQISKHAIIQKIVTGSRLKNQTTEDTILRLIRNGSVETEKIDVVILGGGFQNIQPIILEQKLKSITTASTPFLIPEIIYGIGDNAGGFLGILSSIGLFKNKIQPTCEYRNGEFVSNPYQGNIKNALVITADKTGYCSITYLTKP